MKRERFTKAFFLSLLFLIFFLHQTPLFAMGNKEKPLIIFSPSKTLFSPNGDGIQDSLVLSFEIHLNLKSIEGYVPLLVVDIKNEQNELIRSLVLQEEQDLSKAKAFFTKRKKFTLYRELLWDGKNHQQEWVPDGNYFVEITLEDEDENSCSQIFRGFTIDTIPPEVTLFEGASFNNNNQNSFFSPNGDGKKDQWEISPKGSVEKEWYSRVLSDRGVLIKEKRVSHSPPPSLSWDGRDINGENAPDGNYHYEIESTDEAGNHTLLIFDKIFLNRTTPQVSGIFSSRSLLSYKPNEKIFFTPHFTSSLPLTKWEFALLKKKDQSLIFLSESNRTLPQQMILNSNNLSLSGESLEEGFYDFSLNLYFQNGSEASFVESLYLDTTPAFAKVTMPTWDYFSPKEESPFSFFRVEQYGSKENCWDLTIQNESSEIVYQQKQYEKPLSSFEWNGLTEKGEALPDGVYSYHLRAINPVGEITFEQRYDDIKIHYYETGINAQYPSSFFSSKKRVATLPLQFNYQHPENIIRWNYFFAPIKQEPLFSANGKGSDLPNSLSLSNLDAKKSPLPEGEYQFHYEVQYNNGETEILEEPFYVDKTASSIQITTTPDPFRKQHSSYTTSKNSGTSKERLYKTIEATDSFGIQRWELTFSQKQGTAIGNFIGEGNPSFQIFWEEIPSKQPPENYWVKLHLFDYADNESVLEEKIETPMLIVKKEERFYLMLPLIFFAPYQKDLESIGEKQYDLLKHSLGLVKQLLERYPHYHLLIEGHGLNLYTPQTEKWISEEKRVEEITHERALAVQAYLLKELKIKAQRIHVESFGSKKPLYPPSDFQNNGKNRRVELILIPQEKIKEKSETL